MLNSRGVVEACSFEEDEIAVVSGPNVALEVKDSSITGSRWFGMVLSNTEATITGCTVRGSFRSGLLVEGESSVVVVDSRIEGNGTCGRGHGIEITGSPHLEIHRCAIVNNAGWGIYAELKACGFHRDNFTGKVILHDTEISGNGLGQVCPPHSGDPESSG